MQRELTYDPVFDAQTHYRLLLDAMARPGELRRIPVLEVTPPSILRPAAALVGFALLNADVSFYAGGPVADYLRENTDAIVAEPMDADFLFLQGTDPAVLVDEAKIGTLPYPEGGATLVLSVDALSAGAPASRGGGLVVTLTGPGIARENTLHIAGLNADVLDSVRRQNLEFPLGVDVILADAGGNIACIPRSSRINQIAWDM